MDKKMEAMVKLGLPIFSRIAEKMGLDLDSLHREFDGSTFEIVESDLSSGEMLGDGKPILYDCVKVTVIVTKKNGEKLPFHVDFPEPILYRLPLAWQTKIIEVQV